THVRVREVRARSFTLEDGDGLIEVRIRSLGVAAGPVEMRQLGERSADAERVVAGPILRQGMLVQLQGVGKVACVPGGGPCLGERLCVLGMIVASQLQRAVVVVGRLARVETSRSLAGE